MSKNRAVRGVTAVLALGLVTVSACGRGQQSAEGGGGTQNGFIGVSMRFIAGNSWLTTLSNGAVTAGKAKGYDVQAVDAQGSATQQIQQIQTFINRGAKAIIVEPVGDRSVASGIEAAKRAGVPVVVVNDRVAPELATKVACNVYDDGSGTAKQVGARTAAAAAERFGKSKPIKLYIQALFPQELVTQVRENGFMDGWNSYFQANPGYTIKRVPNNYGQALPDKTLTAMRNVLAGNPDINVVFNQTDVVMGAVTEALKGAGKMKADGSTEVIIAGFDGGMDVVRDMSTNSKSPVVADGLNQPATQAAWAVEEAIAAATEKPTGKCTGSPANRVLPPAIVTPENAKDFVQPELAFAGTR
jgi:ribose transport system substrate-binding protein